MPIPPHEQLQAVVRGLTTVERDGQQARRLTAERAYPAAIEEVWDALTSPDRVPRWMGGAVTGDLSLGGRYQIEGNAGGEVLACEPPTTLALTWEYGGEVSWVEVTLTSEAEQTRVLLVHTATVPKEFWDRFGPGAVGIGWEMMLWGLHEHLTSPDMPRAELDAWLASPEGRAYHVEVMTGSNAAWAEASIADGTDAGAAREAADRCLAAYTAEPEG